MTTEPSPGPSNKKRLLFLAGIAALSVVLAVVAVVQTNREEQKRQEEVLKPAASRSADSGQNPELSNGGTSDAQAPGASSPDADALNKPAFPGDDKASSDYPVTSAAGSKKKKSAEEQKTGEQILADIAEGIIGNTIDDRTRALLRAKAAFKKSIKEDARNEAAYYGLSYTDVNIASGYQVTKTKTDDAQIQPLMRAALSESGTALKIAREDKNPVIVELANNLIKGVTPYVKK